MARFYAEIEGSSGQPVHRLGSPNSGVRAEARGWDSGVTVYASVDSFGQDMFEVWSNGGSNKSGERRLLVTVANTEDGRTLILHPNPSNQ